MAKSIKKNYIYNTIYQIYKIIIPIVLTPYIARVLGDDGSGQYAFSYSIVTYFTLFANLGFASYAQRLVASHQGNKKKQSIDFWEITIGRCIPVVLSIVIYLGIIVAGIFDEKYTVLLFILTLEIVAICFDISFLLQGNEEFGSLVVRNVIIKTLSVIAIFILVRTKTDLWIYTLIQGITILLSNVALWVYVPKTIEKVRINDIKPLRHLPGAFILFLPTIAASIYTSLDKTLIGLITKSDSQLGNYEYAEKLIKVSMTVITSLGTVLIPRNAKRFADGDIEGVKKNIYISSKFVLFLGVPLMLGCIAISDNLIPWFLGQEYTIASPLMKILSPIIIIIGMSNVFGLQFLIPSNEDKKFTFSIIIGATSNFILNIFMIRAWGAYGAAIATLVAESLVTGIMMFFIKEHIYAWNIIKSGRNYYLAGIIMFIPCFVLSSVLSSSIINTVIITFVSVLVYFSVLALFKDDFILMVTSRLKKQ